MDRYHARTQQLLRERFGRLLAAWLATLPPEGWSGGVDSLRRELDRLNESGSFHAYVPSKSGLSKALLDSGPGIQAAGWAVAFRRTAKARTVALTRRR